jgi:aerobic carbon-monoxide dehydrogenase large subunit
MNEAVPRLVGRRVRRIEDPVLLRGAGRYVDDIKLPDTLHAAFVRSPHAHALIKSIKFDDVHQTRGVVATFIADDLAKTLTGPRLPLAFPPGKLNVDAMPLVLASREVCYVGETIALIIASSRYLAEDAADRVAVDYEVLPALVDPREAAAANAARACMGAPTNLFTRFEVGYGDCALEFKSARHVFRESLFQHRGVAHPIEGRGILAHVEAGTGVLTVWSSTQIAHELRDNIVEMLGVDVDTVHVIAPEVGGGFGAKFLVYSEEIAVVAAAKLLQRPVKWIEDRREHFLSAIQERDQYWTLEVAVDSDGRLRGVRGQLTHDQGAYAPHSITVPYNSASALIGPYVLPSYHLDVVVVRTNKPPVIPVRGAGYPQGTFAMERLLDLVARKIGLDRAEIRRRNLIPAVKMPYPVGLTNRAGAPVVYDSGEYETCQNRALATADYAGFADRQKAARALGRYIGLGFAHGVKCTGRGPYESATVRVAPSGRVSVYTGALEIGQGTKTALAQICADNLGVNISEIEVVCGDTAFISSGVGAFASRQTVVAGSAVQLAASAVREKAIKVAFQMLASETGLAFSNSIKELVVGDGKVQVTGRPDLAIPLGRIAVVLRGTAGYWYPEDVEVGLEATRHFRVDAMTYANAFHVCEVEVNAANGHVQILRYIALQDSGKVVNPLVAEGQICGGVVHGIGNALFESMMYDDQGQPITTTFADYLLPTATEVPNVEAIMHETLSPLNPMGMKGVGEVSVVPVTSAIISAIENALEPIGVLIRESPISPVRLLQLMMQVDDNGRSRAEVRKIHSESLSTSR